MTSPSKRSITMPRGFSAAAVTCGIKPSGKPDLTLIVSDEPCTAAGTFTKNKLPGAPLIVSRAHLRARSAAKIRAVICNSGIANDATGQQGVENAKRTCELVAQRAGCKLQHVLPASTGVIGPQLPMDKIEAGVAEIWQQLGRGAQADAAAATGIMTTDLTPKSALRRLKLGGKTVHIGGIAKGSGMIAPNMATMLVFLTTDAAIDLPALKAALLVAVETSFNRISVDGHTSPSDMALILANGLAGNDPVRMNEGGEDWKRFTVALTEICQDLAYQIVEDGEGATKVFRVRVTGAVSERDANRVAQTVINSPLVKTAVHGSDPNWGRVVTAAGNSGAKMQPRELSLFIGPKRDVCVFDQGTPAQLKAATVKKLERLMAQKEVVFTLDLGLGESETQWLGCDLSREYITINADYTT